MDLKENVHPINVDFFEDLTGDIKNEPTKKVEEIGNRIRSLRQEKGLTLDELSRLTGFDIEFLSSIENNETQPQLGALIKLSKALDAAFSRLVSGVGEKLYSITRKSEQKIVSRSTSKKGAKQVYTYKSLAPEVQGRHMEALIVELFEASEQHPAVHEGEEFIYVLEGDITVKLGNETFDLAVGDSVYYLSTTQHLLSPKKDKAKILAVIYGG
ncbi:MAG: helix-turn-helix transcriptional regulator [Desulfobacterales bacterium]|nr:helix-turn-helix transcriptional regulator [Desulfobacterales bacterium]